MNSRVAKVANLYTKKQFTLREIANELSISHESVRNDLRRAGVRIRSTQQAHEVRRRRGKKYASRKVGNV